MKFDYVENKLNYKGYVIYKRRLKINNKLSNITEYEAFEISANQKTLIAYSSDLKAIKNKINDYISKKHSNL